MGFKGKRQIAVLQTAKRRVLITVVTCREFRSSTSDIPKDSSSARTRSCLSPGPIHACQPSGYIYRLVSPLHLQRETHSSKPCDSCVGWPLTPFLNTGAVNAGRENLVAVDGIPPHSSHKMQPLYTTMGPSEIYYP